MAAVLRRASSQTRRWTTERLAGFVVSSRSTDALPDCSPVTAWLNGRDRTYVFGQRVMDRIASTVDVTEAPVQRGSYKMVNCTCSGFHPRTEGTRSHGLVSVNYFFR